MKKIIYAIVSLIFLFYNITFAEYIEYNTESNVKKAMLIEDYIIKHKQRVEKIIKNYEINGNTKLYDDLEVLNESIDALRKIENTNVEKKKAEDIIKAVLERIKQVNESLKEKLKIEKEKFEKKLAKKKQVYVELGKKISEKIDNINIMLAKKIINNKTSLNSNIQSLKNSLIILNKESIKLKNFGNLEFNSEQEIKDSFVEILKNIKNEVNFMTNTLN